MFSHKSFDLARVESTAVSPSEESSTMNRAAVDNAMLTNSLGSSFSASFKFRGSLEGGLDGLDFSDNLDLLDEHMLDDIFPEDGQGNHDDSFRDSFMATFSIPTEQPSAGGSSEKATGDAIMSNSETDRFQIELMGMATTRAGASSMMSGGAAATAAAWPRPRRCQTLETTEEFEPEPIRGPPRRRSTTTSVPDYMMERHTVHGHNPTYGSDEFGHQGNRRLPERHISRGNSDSVLLHSENPSRGKYQINTVDFGNEPLAADINLAVHEAQDKIIRLKGLLGREQQGLVSDIVGGNNYPHAQGQMSYQPAQPAPSHNGPMRRTSEHGLPWTPPCSQDVQQMQGTLQQVTMAKLQAAMERTTSTMKLLQDWDRAHGLPASHCQTMVNTSRSRKQLKEGVVLKKWNGSPLLNESR